MKKNSYVFLANGFEEVEALTAVDLMRRAGIAVATVSINDTVEVEGAHGIVVKADTLFSNADFAEVEWLVLPGGMPGALNLHNFAPLNELLLRHNLEGGKIAAICAAPAVVLAPIGVLDGKDATCYPGFEDKLNGANYKDVRVVRDGNVVTACGPAAAMDFALQIVKVECGDDAAASLANGLLLNK